MLFQHNGAFFGTFLGNFWIFLFFWFFPIFGDFLGFFGIFSDTFLKDTDFNPCKTCRDCWVVTMKGIWSSLKTIQLFDIYLTIRPWGDAQHTEMTYSTLRYWKIFFASLSSIMRAFFWNQKIRKIMTPKGFYTQNRGWKVNNF